MEDPLIAQIIKLIIALMFLAYVISAVKLFSKKSNYRDSVSSSRNQNELLNKK